MKLSWEDSVLWLRAQPDQQELVRACYYDDPLLEAAQRFERSSEWQAVLTLLPRRPGRALDLGAGRGISSYALARAGWRVDALEPDPSQVVGRGAIQSLASETRLPFTPVDGYAESVPFEVGTFDLVYGRQVMHHARDLRKMCREVARALKPGGLFISTREHVLSRVEDLPVFLENHPLHKFYGGEHAFLLSEYIAAIQEADLKIVANPGPFESPINYHPLTFEQVRSFGEQALARKLGLRLAMSLLDENHALGRALTRWILSALSRRDSTPGRLYTFVAVK